MSPLEWNNDQMAYRLGFTKYLVTRLISILCQLRQIEIHQVG